MNVRIKEYRHFSFDLWLTIIKSHPKYKCCRDRLLRDYFSISKSIQNVAEVVRYYDLLCNDISQKTGRHFHFSEIILLILKRLRVTIDDIDQESILLFYEETDSLLMDLKPKLIDDNVRSLFEKIRGEGKTMNIASNTAFIQGKTLRKVLNFYGLSDLFSFQIYSDEIGFSKPSSFFFDAIFENIKKIDESLTKKEVVHIGDNFIADHKGARLYGFNSILIKK
ncbi:MAG: HAD family hydrolase [Capnocytophaga felis]|nr:HAD family hydrolase [Capnocytophaga felis]